MKAGLRPGSAGGEGQAAARLAAQAAVGALSAICPCEEVVTVATVLDPASPSLSQVCFCLEKIYLE